MDKNNISIIIPTRNCKYLERVLLELDSIFKDIVVVGESSINFKKFNNDKYNNNPKSNAAKNEILDQKKQQVNFCFF